MTEYSKTVPKDPAGGDETLKTILDVIIFQTQDGDELISYGIKPASVILNFESVD
jgi:hypothetical protein